MISQSQENCLLVTALLDFAYKYRDDDPHLAYEAWRLAGEFAYLEHLEVEDAVQQLEWSGESSVYPEDSTIYSETERQR